MRHLALFALHPALDTTRMTAIHPATIVSPSVARPRGIAVLRAILIGEALAALAATIALSMLASALANFLGGDSGRAAEETVRFTAAIAFIVAIAVAVTARGVRLARSWSWTAAALLQVVIAGATALAAIVVPWHPVELVGFVLPVAGMLVLSTPGVRRALGQV